MKLSPKKTPFRVLLGTRGEMLACDYLCKQGYQILEKNFRCKMGEMDAIAEKAGRLRFIEIKTRSGPGFGRPEESVHPLKQKKLTKLAMWYLKEKKISETSISFDVLAVEWSPSAKPVFTLIEDAFEASPNDWAM
ncbi:MAG TPA: YraN family protein [bacterium]|nr:YraN family protein [bacterium]